MDSQDSRLSNRPSPKSAKPSIPMSAESYKMRRNDQQVPLSNDSNISEVPAKNSGDSVTPVVGLPSQSVSARNFKPPGENPGGQQTPASQFGGTQFYSQNPLSNAFVWNTASLFFNNLGSVSNSMSFAHNKANGYPTLAPAPTPTPAPVAKTLVESPTPSALAMAPSTAASTLVNPNGGEPMSIQTNANAQSQPVPLPTPNLPINPAATPKQVNPVKSTPNKTSTTSRKRRNKRKRGHDSDDEIKAHDSSSDDEPEDMIPSARQTKSGRQVNRPSFFAPSPEPVPFSRQKSSPLGTVTVVPAKRRRKVYRKNGKEINVTCRYCHRGHSPATNMIVFCDECNDAYHQYCHDPPIRQELIDDKDAQWFCSECRPETRHRVLLKLKLPPQQKDTPSTETQVVSVPLVSGEQFTAEEQRAYLSTLSHAALVEMIASLSEANPNLPLYPENLRDLPQSKFAVTSLTATNPVEPTELATVEPKDVETPSVDEDDSDADSDSGSEYEVEEHRLYPRSGNGFRLPPEEDDLAMLLDDPACPSFSHKLHSYAPSHSVTDTTQTIQVGG